MTAALATCEDVAARLGKPGLLLLDCRYDLADPDKGPRLYAQGHIPGAFHAHVDRDLSGPVGDGSKGRHPLPLTGAFQRFLAVKGLTPQTHVVCYDDVAGQWASRAWWLLRHYGHEHVQVLDGGLTRWNALGLPLRSGHEKPPATTVVTLKPGSMPTVQLDDLNRVTLLDARAPERFRGEVEPVDKRAGHIPGARNLPFAGNVGPDMRFLSPEALKQRFAHVEGPVACYCGSGVTATHNVLAMAVAGLPVPALYPGSWSEYSHPPAARSIETGPAPDS